ncbi:hypothetical protein BBF96_08680 [Anoxybacter fermentans]|uniref:CobQ/CobB/MinD/ParA nucleotide binding domain-containing protein n=1 Tax=Anoxybacter fermentans TaxID=1323375 RepID=A0A3Q9HQR2_9FIRM|nr:ATP-binding protein [Anoxybacter fermentans]AZR73451.1 hypothetical protein BBF96_08680 [Anoxybacter fermentans]
MSDKRIQIFTGAYGSGKTEVSMNFAVDLKKEHEKVALVDLDIVNPYFRSREAAGPLREKGVEVIFPAGVLATADLPALSPHILRVLQNQQYQVVFDVGGDDVGAVALGRFNSYFKEDQYDMNFVVNTNRPFTRDVMGIEKIINKVMKSSRLKVTHLIANINLCNETTVEDIMKGYPIIKEVSSKLKVPIKYLAVEESLKDELDPNAFDEPVRFIHLYNRPDWLKRMR